MHLALTQLRSTTGPRKNLALVTDMAHRGAANVDDGVRVVCPRPGKLLGNNTGMTPQTGIRLATWCLTWISLLIPGVWSPA